jgi:hypothetical protein
MDMTGIPFATTDWSAVERTEHKGELITELQDGRKFVLKPGMSYQVSDNTEPHRSFTPVGAKLFVVD